MAGLDGNSESFDAFGWKVACVSFDHRHAESVDGHRSAVTDDVRL